MGIEEKISKYLSEAKMKDFDELLKKELNDSQKEILVRATNEIGQYFRNLKVNMNNDETKGAVSDLYQIQAAIDNLVKLMKKKK